MNCLRCNNVIQFCFSFRRNCLSPPVKSNIITGVFIANILPCFFPMFPRIMLDSLKIAPCMICFRIVRASILVCLFISRVFISHIRVFVDLSYIMDRIYIASMLIMHKDHIHPERSNDTVKDHMFIRFQQICFYIFFAVVIKHFACPAQTMCRNHAVSPFKFLPPNE